MNKPELERFVVAMKHVSNELHEVHRNLSVRDLHLVQAGIRSIYLSEAIERGDDESEKHHRAVLRKLFEEIEPASVTRLKTAG